jgi:hypothetical protein
VGLIAEMLCATAADKRAKDAGRRKCAMRKFLPVNRGGAHLTLAVLPEKTNSVERI